MFATLISWGCKINADVVYTLDGSRARVGSGKSAYVASGRVAIAHDGSRVGGRLLEEPEGHDNYLAELAAQIDALMHAPAKSRVILVFDATSPVEAVRRYQRLHVRRKQGRHASGMLQTLERAIARHECVVFIWQPSHTGAPVNEWADKGAARAVKDGEPTHVHRSPRTFESMRFPGARQGLRAWLRARCGTAASEWLRQSSQHTEFPKTGDMRLRRLSDGQELSLIHI